jgi:hypothetical protein
VHKEVPSVSKLSTPSTCKNIQMMSCGKSSEMKSGFESKFEYKNFNKEATPLPSIKEDKKESDKELINISRLLKK